MSYFNSLGLDSQLQKNLTRMGFLEPKKIQVSVIPLVFEGKDVMACAETGSGKTAAYGIPLVSLALDKKSDLSLILVPTRELAKQVEDFLFSLIKGTQLKVVSIVGGQDIWKQKQKLMRKPQLIVATPGRLIDHLKRKNLSLKNCNSLVLDEGDRMLDMGFAPQLNEILKYLSPERNTLLFTATLPKKVQSLAESYLQNPVKIDTDRVAAPVASIRQTMVQVKNEDKQDKLVDELNVRSGAVIVFTRTKQRADDVAQNLSEYGFSVALLHGGRSQGQRNRAISQFRGGQARILCATDIAARGIDVPHVEHVINFDLPIVKDDYIHRIGRTGRNGADGEALSFVSPRDNNLWNYLMGKRNDDGGASAGGRSKNSRGKRKGRPFRPRGKQKNSSSRGRAQH